MTDPRIQFEIDNLQENLEVEVKNWLNGLQDNSDKAKLAKEIIALANNGGGRIYIGFNDDDMSEIEPSAGQLEAYSQDKISEVVNRYVSPPCQCFVEVASRSESTQQHPIIIVPGGHRTPLSAARGGPNNEVVSGKVYLRRPGGYSEEARNQDDWEKLIDRLVAARQGEMIGQIREILEPTERALDADQDLEDWHSESYHAWENVIAAFPDGDPRRCEAGHWMVSFHIDSFQIDSLAELNRALEREMPKFSGWPPFTYIHREPLRPQAHGDLIVAYLGHLGENESIEDRLRTWDFWQLSRDGRGFLLRPMEEDDSEYRANVTPRGSGPFFDWVLPIYRCIEVLKFIEKLGSLFSEPDASFDMILEYRGTSDRYLEQSSLRYNLSSGATCRRSFVKSITSGSLSEISTNLEEILISVLNPIYEQFDFAELPTPLVNNIVKEALGNER